MEQEESLNTNDGVHILFIEVEKDQVQDFLKAVNGVGGIKCDGWNEDGTQAIVMCQKDRTESLFKLGLKFGRSISQNQ